MIKEYIESTYSFENYKINKFSMVFTHGTKTCDYLFWNNDKLNGMHFKLNNYREKIQADNYE